MDHSLCLGFDRQPSSECAWCASCQNCVKCGCTHAYLRGLNANEHVSNDDEKEVPAVCPIAHGDFSLSVQDTGQQYVSTGPPVRGLRGHSGRDSRRTLRVFIRSRCRVYGVKDREVGIVSLVIEIPSMYAIHSTQHSPRRILRTSVTSRLSSHYAVKIHHYGTRTCLVFFFFASPIFFITPVHTYSRPDDRPLLFFDQRSAHRESRPTRIYKKKPFLPLQRLRTNNPKTSLLVTQPKKQTPGLGHREGSLAWRVPPPKTCACLRFTGRARRLINKSVRSWEAERFSSPFANEFKAHSVRQSVRRSGSQISTREVELSMGKENCSLSILLYVHLRIIFTRIGVLYQRCCQSPVSPIRLQPWSGNLCHELQLRIGWEFED